MPQIPLTTSSYSERAGEQAPAPVGGQVPRQARVDGPPASGNPLRSASSCSIRLTRAAAAGRCRRRAARDADARTPPPPSRIRMVTVPSPRPRRGAARRRAASQENGAVWNQPWLTADRREPERPPRGQRQRVA